MQQYVKGEAASAAYSFSSAGRKVEEPVAPIYTTEPSLTDKTDPAEDLQKADTQRRYSVDWDPIQYVHLLSRIL